MCTGTGIPMRTRLWLQKKPSGLNGNATNSAAHGNAEHAEKMHASDAAIEEAVNGPVHAVCVESQQHQQSLTAPALRPCSDRSPTPNHDSTRNPHHAPNPDHNPNTIASPDPDTTPYTHHTSPPPHQGTPPMMVKAPSIRPRVSCTES